MIDASGFGLGLLGIFYSPKTQQAKRARAAPHQYTTKQRSGSPQLAQLISASWQVDSFIQTTNKKTGALLPDEDGRGPDVNLAVALQLSS